MQRDPSASHQPAEQVGALARHVLAADPGGTVLASHSRATYLLSAGGELLWLAPADIPLHRRGVRVAGSMPRVATGSTYRVVDDCLRLGRSVLIDLGQASAWEPECRSGSPLPAGTTPERPSGSSDELLRHLPPPKGFGAFLPALSAYAQGGSLPTRQLQASQVLTHASPAVFGLARACRERDEAALLVRAADLVGLGEGLTPSGDDFVGGVLFGLAMLRDAGTRLPGSSPHAVASFLERSQTRTNRISFALLSDHGSGYACEPAHRFMLGLMVEDPPELTGRAASDLIRIGHSTGWDLLAGMWTAWALVSMQQSVVHTRVDTGDYAATP